MEDNRKPSVKQKLIIAGIEEIEENGIQNFSMRHIAARCGVSCAAPYKHFEDKQEFLMAIIRYINEEWYKLQVDIIRQAGPDYRMQLIELSMAYIKFLLDNPHFRSVIMLKDVNMTEEFQKEKSKLSDMTASIVDLYCKSVNMPEITKVRKLYIVRSLIYGASLLMDNGELQCTDDIMEQIRRAISREFDIE